jgi:hypothetical protein
MQIEALENLQAALLLSSVEAALDAEPVADLAEPLQRIKCSRMRSAITDYIYMQQQVCKVDEAQRCVALLMCWSI